jgi:23S rRNA G2069 N7-methylase RlmK/C1962 C5-methylase RlmI
MTDADFGLALGQGMHRADRLMREIGRVGLPPDFPCLPAFPEGAYLKVRLLQYYS